MFSTTIAGTTETADFFVLPPTAGAALQSGRVVEEVRFARDEMANMAWAIENILENAASEPWPQHERESSLLTPATPPANATALKYAIESRIPTYWIPFLPESLHPEKGVVVLSRGVVVTSKDQPRVQPRGRILQPSGMPEYQLPEEEVPRNGVKVQRFAARSRWTDGSTRLWQMRRVQPGTAEAASALKFDQANNE
jgi:hypothetical protein